MSEGCISQALVSTCKSKEALRNEHRPRADNRLIAPEAMVGHCDGEVQCRERLGGLLKYYYRSVA
jgi:hypothetical protein